MTYSGTEFIHRRIKMKINISKLNDCIKNKGIHSDKAVYDHAAYSSIVFEEYKAKEKPAGGCDSNTFYTDSNTPKESNRYSVVVEKNYVGYGYN
jgi:hypothetical protein